MNNRYQNWVNQMAGRVNLGFILVRPNGRIANAHATTTVEGSLLIEYNPVFMFGLERHSGWAVLMVLAHEVAHHYNKDLYGRFLGVHNTEQRQELNADRFAGHMLRCYGAEWNQATDAYKLIDFRRSTTHPGKAARVDAFRMGFNEAVCHLNPPQRVVRKNDTEKALLGVAAGLSLVLLIAGLVRSQTRL